MIKYAARKLALVLALVVLAAAPIGKALAQSPSATPAVVTGGDPEPGDPDTVVMILVLLQLA